MQLLDDKSLGSPVETLSSPLLRGIGEARQEASRFPKHLVDEVESSAAGRNVRCSKLRW